MLLKTQAICVKNTRFGESGVISKLFTQDHGMASFLVQGINRKSSLIKASHILPGNIIEIVYYRKSTNNLSRIKEIKLIENLYNNEDIGRTSVLQFIIEIISKTNEDEVADDEIYNFIKYSIISLKNDKLKLKFFPLIFLCKYLKYSGWYPNFEKITDESIFNLNEGKFVIENNYSDKFILDKNLSTKLFEVFDCAEKYDYPEINLSFNHKEVFQCVITYYEIHLLKGKKIKSPEIFSDILGQ